jgi:hypothetical protein
LDDHNRAQSWIRECSATHGHSDRYSVAIGHIFIHPNGDPFAHADRDADRHPLANLDFDRITVGDCDNRADPDSHRYTHSDLDRGSHGIAVAITHCDRLSNTAVHRDPNRHAYRDADTHRDRHTNAHRFAYANGYADHDADTAAAHPPE